MGGKDSSCPISHLELSRMESGNETLGEGWGALGKVVCFQTKGGGGQNGAREELDALY